MIKLYSKALFASLAILFFLVSSCTQSANKTQKPEAYDGPAERDAFEFERTKDPLLNRVPTERLFEAMLYTDQMKNTMGLRNTSLVWTERGPAYDSVGPSGNRRGGNPLTRTAAYTAGRIRAVLVDGSDATGNTLWVGGVCGGLWKCTNFTSNADPDWMPINDLFTNMAISSICQNPSNTNVMYFSTGEPTSNADAVLGKGVWKSTDHGITWAQLVSTASYTRIFKILCDNNGNVYMATRGSGLLRSTNGGLNWTTITPSDITSTNCTDIELSTNGKLYASFGYSSGTGGSAYVRYAENPSTVTTSGWNVPTGLPSAANRIELATKGNLLYAAPTANSSSNRNHILQTYKSTDGGATWTLNNTTNYAVSPQSITRQQGWYDISLEISPTNDDEFIVAGVDAWRSTNGGQTVSRLTYWVGNTSQPLAPYVHADHHYAKWYTSGLETRIIMATDGGVFYSTDNGTSFTGKNKNLRLKQFYSVAIHPTLPNYFLAGAQDNGSHQFKQSGLGYSTEVTGGDGAFVDIDQNEPQYQFTSYVYNNYFRSSDGGNTWVDLDLSSSYGEFINPFDYDDVQNIMYCSDAGNTTTSLRRFENPQTAVIDQSLSINTVQQTIISLGNNGDISALLTSPITANRLFIGTSFGEVIKLNNANIVTNADASTNMAVIGSFSGYISCIALGSTEQYMAVTSSSYGVNQVMYTSNGGTTWQAVDGNLPDMPVRWALFDPNSNDKLIIATEAGVYITSDVTGSSTQWLPSAGFPTVRTDMLKLRPSDKLIAAATHGRGLFTAYASAVFPLSYVKLSGSLAGDNKSKLTWETKGETSATKYHVQYSTDGVSFTEVGVLPYNKKDYTHLFNAPTGYYRIMGEDPKHEPVFSNVIAIKSNRTVKNLQVMVSPNPVSSSANFVITSGVAGDYSWNIINLEGKILQSGKGNLPVGGSVRQPLNVSGLSAGMYRLRVVQGKQVVTSAFIKQ